MLASHLKFAIGSSLAALLSAQVLIHTQPKTTARTGTTQPKIALAASAQTQAVRPAAYRNSIGAYEHRIAADPLGQYFTSVEIGGARIRMLVDTGASAVALSYEDAAAAGVFPFPSDFKHAVSTANGLARVAHVRLDEVRVGSLRVRDVDAVVGERGALGSSLLGMTFLSKLSKIESSRGTLVLRQ